VLEDYVSSLRDEIEHRGREWGHREGDLGAKLSGAERRHKELVSLNERLNEEYFGQKAAHENCIKKLQEEKELLRLKATSLRCQYEEVLTHKTLENQVNKEMGEKRAKEYASGFKQKSIRKEETLHIAKEQYKKVKLIYKEKSEMLQTDVGMLKNE
jgi:hypothetical protein